MATDTKEQGACLQAEPQAQHRWVEQFVGERTTKAATWPPK